jgi:hypothetical protein
VTLPFARAYPLKTKPLRDTRKPESSDFFEKVKKSFYAPFDKISAYGILEKQCQAKK